jgi:hypothetical protein
MLGDRKIGLFSFAVFCYGMVRGFGIIGGLVLKMVAAQFFNNEGEFDVQEW